MKKRVGISLVLLLTFLGLGWWLSNKTFKPLLTKQLQPQITEISLERKGCFIGCPVDKVILRSDGTATYEGKEFVNRVGVYRGKIAPYYFAKLTSLLEEQNYFDLRDSYEESVGSDFPFMVTSVVSDNKRKTIVSYEPDMPISLWGITRAVIALIDEIQEWEKQ